ncbi:hypothetical protein MVES_002436 [Malassezia vespertilionis]|uniref:Uncharacterized protein n=1 Tax=Malassezia vespertilionis TaxID=2020962 RepID=A0A2N1JA82_9BASI|nr:hypothetical protein MVES_002436 [Malassezia vespertilionis]
MGFEGGFFVYAAVVLVALVSTVVSIGLTIAIIIPFVGTLTLLRANYLPMAVSLDNVLLDGREDELEQRSVLRSMFLRAQRSSAKIGPVVRGVFPMMARVRRLEGWRGLYKGSTVLAVGGFITAIPTILVAIYSARSGNFGRDEQYTAFSPFRTMVSKVILAMVSLPFDVVLKRTIVHPRRLDWFKFRSSLREILCKEEYEQPWRLYLLPGVVPALLLRVAVIEYATMAIGFVIFNDWIPDEPGLTDPNKDDFHGRTSESTMSAMFGYTLLLLWCMAIQFAVVPLECITVRLTTQRPVDQQPLHIAFAQQAQPEGPSAVSHQATAAPPQEVRATREPEPFTDEAEEDSETAPALGEHDTETCITVEEDARMTEPVIALRPCDEPDNNAEAFFGASPVERYTGIVDCFQKMVAEEGYETSPSP